MPRSILSSVHISSIYPASLAEYVSIETTRSDLPISVADPNVLLEHASFSTSFSSDSTGTMLMRVIHGGLILEIIPLSTGSPIRFSFPAPIIPSPAVLLHQLSELRIFVVTSSGSLFVLTFPVSVTLRIPEFDVTSPARLWCKEYLINTSADEFEGPVHVKDIDCILVGMRKGRFLRLDCGMDYSSWQESVHRIKTSWTSYVVLDSDESHIVSFASYPPPSDSIIHFSLSRDCTLRAWNYGTCLASYSINSTLRASLTPLSRDQTPTNDSRRLLLDPEPQKLLYVLSASEDDINVDDDLRILVFIPALSSVDSSDWFHLFRLSPTRATNKELSHVQSITCPHRTGGAELRDFMVHQSSLYALWNQKGQPVVEYTSFDPDVVDDSEDIWYSTTYPSEAELTPDYLDELLLRSGGGSLVDTFMTAILRPGVFSHFTIETALQKYTDTFLAMPGAQSGPLRQSFLTLSEHIAAVVGCTVNVVIDPHTGIPQRANYWNALKRDWKGFVQRCREIERSGRWPLSLAVTQRGTILLLERERAGCVALSDQSLEIRACLSDGDMAEDYPLLQVGSAVRQQLLSAEIHARESQFEIMACQERGYTYAETLEFCVSSLENPRQDVTQFAMRQLVDINDLGVHFEQVLFDITSMENDVKVEEADDGAASVPSASDSSLHIHGTRWLRGVATAYLHASIDARYELCLTLVLLLFHIHDRRKELSPVVLARLFATFRNLVILRYLAWQPAGDPDGTHPTSSIDPDLAVLRDFQNMAVSSRRPVSTVSPKAFRPTYSLNYRLMEEAVRTDTSLPHAALDYLSMMNLLSSQDAAEVTQHEVLLCKWLLDLGFWDVALEIIGKLPRSPGITYVRGLLLVQTGRTDDAASLLRRVGANFGPGALLSDEDSEALSHVLPSIEGPYTESSYYRWIATMFERAGYLSESIQFYKLACELVSAEVDASELWRKVILGYTELEKFEEAYMALVTAPYEAIKRESVSQLVQAMCEANAVERLMSLNFVGLPNEVENALSFKVRNADPLSRPMYQQVLYAWYVFRGDFRNAAATMVQYARRLSSHMRSSQHFLVLSEMQAHAYLVAMNSLSLIDPKNAWISMPIAPEVASQNRKRRKLSKNIPDDKYHKACRDVEVVDLADLRHEYTLVSSRLELIRRQPDLLAASQHFLTGEQIVSSYAQAGSYDYAMSAARSLGVDMTELFERLTIQCLRLARRGEAMLQDDTAEWLRTERVVSWPGTVVERGWRFLRVTLEQHDEAEREYVYRRAAMETMLEHERTRAMPSWLVSFFGEHQPEYLIRTCLRFDLVSDALEHSLSLVKKANASLARMAPQRAGAMWLPYGLLDAVIAAAEGHRDLTPDTHNRLGELRSEVAARVRRVQKLSEGK